MNGWAGSVLKFDQKKGRYIVKLDNRLNDGPKAISPANLRKRKMLRKDLLQDQPAASSPAAASDESQRLLGTSAENEERFPANRACTDPGLPIELDPKPTLKDSADGADLPTDF